MAGFLPTAFCELLAVSHLIPESAGLKISNNIKKGDAVSLPSPLFPLPLMSDHFMKCELGAFSAYLTPKLQLNTYLRNN